MKLRNKKTGEVVKLDNITVCTSSGMLRNRAKHYDTIAELNAEWEDYEELKEYWYIDTLSNEVTFNCTPIIKDIENDKQIGNYFETKKEAELALEKLKAYKRLKDKGFDISLKTKDRIGYLEANWQVLNGDYSDVKICFGEEEE